MSDVLSQGQIDELFHRVKTGEIDQLVEADAAPRLKEYDFASPKKFTKDQLKSLNNLYENFSRVISSYFTSVLRSICEVNVAQIEEQRYYEFNNALLDTALVGIVDFRPASAQYDETSLMVNVSTSFGYLLVERLLGGTEGAFLPNRDYTEIELALIRRVLTKLTAYMQEAWCNYMEVTTDLRSIETNGRLIQAYSPQDVVVIVTLEVSADDYTGNISICMQAETLEKLIRSFSARFSRTARQHDPDRERQKKELLMDYLKQSELELNVLLDQCSMTLGDVLQLQTGDVVALHKRIDSDISVLVEGLPWYQARLGELDMRKAVKIVDLTAT